MAEKPEERARAEIDRLLAAAGWSVQSMSEANIHAARGVQEAVRPGELHISHFTR
jgi:type I restriction enzyme R subunit